MLTLSTQYMKRTDKQVLAIIKSSPTPIPLKTLAQEADLEQRTILRVLRRLRQAKLIRGIRDGQYTFYEPIP
jgi:DNA-binding Lrp family transcriptional regulator